MSILENPSQLQQIIRLQAAFRSKLTRTVHPEPQVKKFYRRYHIASEILSSEESYVNGLRCLIQIYLANLKKIPTDILPPAALKDIFSNSEIIYGYNTIILKQLRARMAKWYTEEMSVGDIFLKFVDFLKVYTAYVNNYSKALHTLGRYAEEQPLVLQSLRESRRHEDINGQELQSYLIMPVQRLPRYIMLLKDLLNCATPGTTEYKNLDNAVERLVEIADYLNKKKGEAENLSLVTIIASKLSGMRREELVSNTRSYVRQGTISTYGDREGITESEWKALSPNCMKSKYCFLFNDMLLITKRYYEESFLSKAYTALSGHIQDDFQEEEELDLNKDPAQFKLSMRLNLTGRNLEIIDLGDQNGKYMFALGSAGKWNIVFAFTTENQKAKWLQDIDDLFWKEVKQERAAYTLQFLAEAEKDNPNPFAKNMSGYLFYQSRQNQWKKKYCSLVGSSFQIFKTEADYKEEKETYSFSLLQANISLWPVMDRPNCFIIGTARQQYYFSSETPQERMMWINAFRSAIKAHIAEFSKKSELSLILVKGSVPGNAPTTTTTTTTGFPVNFPANFPANFSATLGNGISGVGGRMSPRRPHAESPRTVPLGEDANKEEANDGADKEAKDGKDKNGKEDGKEKEDTDGKENKEKEKDAKDKDKESLVGESAKQGMDGGGRRGTTHERRQSIMGKWFGSIANRRKVPKGQTVVTMSSDVKVLWMEDKHHNYQQYNTYFKGNSVFMSRATKNKSTIQLELALCEKIDMDTLGQTTISGETFYTFEIVNHTRRDTYAMENKEELLEWIERFNKGEARK
eukprot:TRINITY_DN2157_c0_g1_i3.p1 TRINITY_DN2157_c0_g1~~TRINITY_DN2157_c0_g1_i3.p1  ORF type:complete len:804 (-),score=191.09 TRINITY_DN2157_c0_g1_i3:181-2592(-)